MSSLPSFLHPSSLADQIILKPVFTGACQAWCWAGNNLNQVNVNQVNANRVNVNPVSVYLVNVNLVKVVPSPAPGLTRSGEDRFQDDLVR